ncbi:MAG: elongator complex protein 3, partial [Cetobacterium sp.]
MKHYNIPIFISHFGCPNDCVFCNQKKINGRETDVTTEDIKNIIESYLKTLPKKSKKEVAFFGGTFTGISIKLQEEYLSVVYEYIKNGLIDGIRISTRPDYINSEIIGILKKYRVTTVELGVQSLDEEVLRQTHRFYPIEKVSTASKLIKEAGIELGIQLMLGLPGSTDESDYISAKKTVQLNPEIARIYPTLVIKETEMADMFKEGKYKPLTLDEAVQRCKKIYALLEYNNINIVRVG